MYKYPSGWVEGDRFRFIGGKRKYNEHIRIDIGQQGTIGAPYNDAFPADAVQVLMDDGGCGALDISCIQKV